ncbi:DUF2170 family protein [Citrobacter sp. MNAZ 1397]|uniref:DUF2170 family protein n=1 Tax=Citrobacter sp. MNAZ 1397 TaxID=2911205 RepID=UPI0032F083B5
MSFYNVLLKYSTLNIVLKNNRDFFILVMRNYGELQLNILLVSCQIMIETYIFPVKLTRQPEKFNAFLLRRLVC